MNVEEIMKKIEDLEAEADISISSVNELRATLFVFLLPQLMVNADANIEIANAYLERFKPEPTEGMQKHLVEAMRDLIITTKAEVEAKRSPS
ncbi:hypothetical protein AAGT95_16660 [Salinicola lusitanus]|uniref:Uncharacterized protein n=1 Tax=Salinicola lusitanus TaxID=1949085 RepID=A0ABZ3CQN0_9GAMM